MIMRSYFKTSGETYDLCDVNRFSPKSEIVGLCYEDGIQASLGSSVGSRDSKRDDENAEKKNRLRNLEEKS